MRATLWAAVAISALLPCQALAQALAAPVADCGPAEQPVYQLRVDYPDGSQAWGSAWMAEGYLVTAYHVVNEYVSGAATAVYAAALGTKEYLRVEPLVGDLDHDVAILSVPDLWGAVEPLALDLDLVDGEPVWAVGFPGTLAEGVLGAFRGPVLTQQPENEDHEQSQPWQVAFDSFVSGGMSGGPLLVCQEDGTMISAGVVTSYAYVHHEVEPFPGIRVFIVEQSHGIATRAEAVLELIDIWETEQEGEGRVEAGERYQERP